MIWKLVCISYEFIRLVRIWTKHISVDMSIVLVGMCWYIQMNNIYSTLLYLRCTSPFFRVWYLSIVDDFTFCLGLMLILDKSRVYHFLVFLCCIFLLKEDCIVSWCDVLFSFNVIVPSSWKDHSILYILHFDVSNLPLEVDRMCSHVCVACFSLYMKIFMLSFFQLLEYCLESSTNAAIFFDFIFLIRTNYLAFFIFFFYDWYHWVTV